MKMFLISDNVDTYTGMRLAGVDGVVVHEREELRDALENVLLYHRGNRTETLVRSQTLKNKL